jgi:hypothetical protein
LLLIVSELKNFIMIWTFLRRRFSWILIGISIILSVTGFLIYFDVNQIKYDFSDLAYEVLQLFLIEASFEYLPINIFLNIARFLAPVSLATALVHTAIRLFSSQFRRRKIKSFKDHIIIFGDSANNLKLASDLMLQGKKYVLVNSGNVFESNTASDDSLFSVEIQNISSSSLRATGFYSCRYLIVSFESDSRSLMLVNELMSVVSHNQILKPLDVVIIFNNPEWTEYSNDLGIIEQVDEIVANHSHLKIRYLSYKDSAIRKVMFSHAPDFYKPVTSTDAPQSTVCVAGFNPITHRLLINLALNSHYINHKKLKVCLFADNSEGFETFVKRYQLEQMLDFELLRLNDIEQFTETSNVFYLTDDDEGNQLLALSSINRGELSGMPVIILSDKSQTAASLVRLPGITFIDLSAQASKFTNIIDESYDELARIIHNNYLNSLEKIDDQRPTHQKWEKLPDEIRNRNRLQADHIWIKLRSLGYHAIPVVAGLPLPDLSTEPHFEALSKTEHNRWNAYMYYQGWKIGTQKNDKRKIHTDLVPYEQLSEDIKQYDRNTIKNIPSLIRDLGFSITREP